MESRDQGKPLSKAASDVEGAARYFEYYAGAADELEGTSVPTGTGQVDFTSDGLSVDDMADTIPLGRLAEPEDIADAATFLASDEAAMITGTALEVDGGRDI